MVIAPPTSHHHHHRHNKTGVAHGFQEIIARDQEDLPKIIGWFWVVFWAFLKDGFSENSVYHGFFFRYTHDSCQSKWNVSWFSYVKWWSTMGLLAALPEIPRQGHHRLLERLYLAHNNLGTPGQWLGSSNQSRMIRTVAWGEIVFQLWPFICFNWL